MTDRAFRTLDGLRGVAAMSIVALHAYRYFGTLVPSAQMAVDLFFVLSGFVLAHAYEPRFRDGTMTPGRFIVLRYARLYPLYLLGIALGIVEALMVLRSPQGAIEWSWAKLVMTLPFSLVMVPTPPIGANTTLFPLNGIMWSIFFELLVNAIWVLLWKRLESTRFLVGVVIASMAAFAIAAAVAGSTALGVGWNTFVGGLARVCSGFFIGVFLYRVRHHVRVPRVHPLLLLAALPALFAFRLPPLLQLACALLVLPVIVLLGSAVEPRGLVAALCHTIGNASYAVYALHNRGYRLSYGGLLQFFGFQAERYAPAIGFLFLTVLVIGCALISEYYDAPLRRALAKRLDPRRRRAEAAALVEPRSMTAP